MFAEWMKDILLKVTEQEIKEYKKKKRRKNKWKKIIIR